MKKELQLLFILGILLLSVGLVSAKTILVSKDPAALAFELGKHEYNKGNLAEAQAAFEQAIELKPDFTQAHHNLAIALYDQGNSEGAIDALQQTLTLDGSYAKAWYSLGLMYGEQGETSRAIAALEQVVALEPSTNAWFDLGVFYVDHFRASENQGIVNEATLQSLQKGLDAYEQVVALDPDFPHAASNAEIVGNVLAVYS